MSAPWTLEKFGLPPTLALSMSSLGVVTCVSGGLQLVVPSYGLRLVRRFGAESVGWFLVIAFSSLALLRVFGTGPGIALPGGVLATEGIFAVGALLLLVGMGHLESIFSERQAVRRKEKDLCGQWTTRIQSETSDLARKNQELLDQRVLFEQRVAALEEAVMRYHLLFDECPQAMWVFDLRTQRILEVNQAAARLYGLPRQELLARQAREMVADSAQESFGKYVARRCTGEEPPICLPYRPKGHCAFEVELIGIDLRYDGSPARLVLASDITPREQQRTELRNAVRLEVISQVAGGFAHHFNNLLAIIEGNAALLEDDQTPDQLAQHVQHISGAVSRGAVLTRQLLAVAGQRKLQVAPIELNGLLVGMNPLLRRLVGGEVSLQTIYDATLPAVLADTYLVEQAVINLVINARDAMPDGGSITIQTSSVRRRVGEDSQVFVRLAIRDTGCGMTPEVQARLFEPFFTTKEVGRGTGLGLASVYGALKQQAGWIEFSSESGQGTEARVYLPCAQDTAVVAGRPREQVALGTVLLVEADDRARSMARCVLNWNGYRVVEADGSATALMLWESQSANIDLLLVDAALTDGLSGIDLARQLLKAKPSLRVVCGSAAKKFDLGDELSTKVRVVTKPYTPEVLLQSVQAAVPANKSEA